MEDCDYEIRVLKGQTRAKEILRLPMLSDSDKVIQELCSIQGQANFWTKLFLLEELFSKYPENKPANIRSKSSFVC